MSIIGHSLEILEFHNIKISGDIGQGLLTPKPDQTISKFFKYY
jgi:hypothetical protein